jgi:two-component system, NtrC family, response regulator
MKPRVLIVDDDEEIRSQLKWGLAQNHQVLTAEDRASALAAFQESRPPVVLLDLGLPPSPGTPEEGLALLDELLAVEPLTKVIVVSGQSEKAVAVTAVGRGAYDFLSKPMDIEEIRLILRRAFHVAQLERDFRQLRLREETDSFEGMLGTSQQVQEVFATVRKVATTEVPVLVLGESGTGKEMVAQAIHQRGLRKDGPFIAINCGAIPETLLESELFGHEKGAFTGAHIQRKGRIELANGGTLFLDEVGELSPPLQIKLLRFVQEQYVERIGGRTPIRVDTRVVAATNADLNKAMEAGRFREDLYYRLAVVVIRLPALRERPGDIPLLAKAFLQRAGSLTSKNLSEFSQNALRALQRHPWPGNIRELENRVKRAVIMAEGRSITPEDLELIGLVEGAFPTLKEVRLAAERGLVQQALLRHGGMISRAAEDLGISRPTLYELIEKLGLAHPDAAKKEE